MAKLRKGNRVIEVKDDFVKGYLQRGYDQINNSGKIIKEATGGKMIPIAEYNKLKQELKELKNGAQGVSQEDYDAVVEELKDVKAKAEEFAEKGKKLQEENNRLKNQQKGQRK